jgi:hypothetical protein
MVSGVTANSVSFSDASANSPVIAGASNSTGATPTAVANAAANTSLPNPKIQFDASLNLVVLEFHSSAGAIFSSIPSQSQLNAYQFDLSTSGAQASATV